jgi:GAF domain-containing protein
MNEPPSIADQVRELIERRPEADGIAAALDRLLEHYAAEMGTIHRLDPSEGMLSLVSARGAIPEPVLALTRRIPLGKGIAGETARDGKPVTICNLQAADARVPAGARATGANGALCVPIFRRGEVVGTLGVGCRGERTFTEAEIADLLAAGEALAEAVVRAAEG